MLVKFIIFHIISKSKIKFSLYQKQENKSMPNKKLMKEGTIVVSS
jgi:hypothetical protein